MSVYGTDVPTTLYVTVWVMSPISIHCNEDRTRGRSHVDQRRSGGIEGVSGKDASGVTEVLGRQHVVTPCPVKPHQLEANLSEQNGSNH